jgi:rhamnopyranosyl-N-acetylglucosaminyl-diphospho-decaprenol beta-1,3/1,4-galactofuranosyltransferase
MEFKANSVGAVIVTYNRRSLLTQVIDSLLAQTRPVDHIYIVDNASTDGTTEYLSSLKIPRMTIRRMPTNTGGAGGFFCGMKWAFDEGHEWIWLMDDDLSPAYDCLEKLLSGRVTCPECEAPPAPAIIPLRLNRDGTVAEWSSRKINLSNPLIRRFRSDLVCDLYSDPSTAPAVIPVIDFTFEGPLFHRKVPEQIGFPRAEFFIYCDETEYALRMQRFGFNKPLCVSAARALRMGDTAFPEEMKRVPWKVYYGWRNRLVVQNEYATNWVMAYRPYLFFALSTLKRLFKGRLPRREALMRWHAFYDSITGTFPRRYLPPAEQSG